ncbi:MAG TPA: Fe-S cluster assembly protein SufD [Chloroflexota bacterium]|nr:Fe-S cluster assembly protein SufD [Chloroflexota bacterium]
MTELATRPTSPSAFTRQAVEELSARNGEPSWLRERRLEALATFERLPIPSRQDEEYRRTDLRRLRLDEFAPTTPNGAGVPGAIKAVLADKGGNGGTLAFVNATQVERSLAAELASKGVVLCSLDQAVREHPDLVRDHLVEDEDKWSAMNSAFWTGGAFVYVPSGVEVTLPLRAVFAQQGAGGATFGKTLIVADEWSQLTYVDDTLSVDGGVGFNTSVVDVFAKEGSVVRYCHVQNWGTGVWNFERERFHAKRDAAINLLQVGLGSRLTKAFVHAHMDEPGVSCELLGLVFIGGTQHIDHSTLQDHRAGHCMSDLLFKCAMLEEARSVYGGLIRIAPGAQRSDAYQNNRNLLLSERARADSIPMLEILANDVRCTHGSTTSSVDEEELFYLMSRGLPKAQAQRMIVEGFFSAVVDRVPLQGLKNRLSAEVERQIDRLYLG